MKNVPPLREVVDKKDKLKTNLNNFMGSSMSEHGMIDSVVDNKESEYMNES